MNQNTSEWLSELPAKYKEVLDNIDDLTPFAELADMLKAMADKGEVNNMRRLLVVAFADMNAEAKQAIEARIAEEKEGLYEVCRKSTLKDVDREIWCDRVKGHGGGHSWEKGMTQSEVDARVAEAEGEGK